MTQRFKANILLVEDYVINQELTKEMLVMLGCTVDIVESGFEALEILSHSTYNLIFMDVQMPGMDGYECTREIRKNEKAHVPIVALTANALQGDREKCIDSGMDDYVSKPFRMMDLETILGRFLEPEE